MAILLDSAQNGNGSLSATHQLPTVTATGDDVLLIAYTQTRPNESMTAPGWTLTQQVIGTLNDGNGVFVYGTWVKVHATGDSPYEDTFTADNPVRWGTAQVALRATGDPITNTSYNYQVYSGGAYPQLTATFPDPTTPGKILIAYVTGTTSGGAGDPEPMPAPIGWNTLVNVVPPNDYIGLARVFYRIADGTETAITVDFDHPNVSQLFVMVAEYGVAEVTPPPPSGDAIELDVYQMRPGDEPPIYLATLFDAQDKRIRIELDGPGEGMFTISRYSQWATAGVLREGNLVKVRIPEIDEDYIFAFFLETGDFTLVSTDEEGGENLTFGGRGILSYLNRAIIWNEAFVVDTVVTTPQWGFKPIGFPATSTGNYPGQIIARLVDEFQHVDRPQHPLPFVTVDFDYDDDSNGEAWTFSDATNPVWIVDVGTDFLSIVGMMIGTGVVTVQMGPDFDFHAYNYFGRDLTGDEYSVGEVRFEKGVNIRDELKREIAARELGTHALVIGDENKYGTAVIADAADLPTREVAVSGSGTVEDALDEMGAADLVQRTLRSEAITIGIDTRRVSGGGDADDGKYLPGDEDTDNGDFWVGDTVRVHTGTSETDFNERDMRVAAITIWREENNELGVNVELGSTAGLHDPTFSSSTGSYPGGGIVTGAGSGTGGGAGAHVHSDYETTYGGGNPGVHDHGDFGAAETIDAADGNQHRGVLDQDSTITVADFPDGGIILKVTNDGGFGITWVNVIFPDGADDQPAQGAGDVSFYTFISDDGDVYGFPAGGSGGSSLTPSATVEDETTFGITPAAGTSDDYSRGDHTHGTPAEPTSTSGVMPLLADGHGNPFTFDDVLQADDGSTWLFPDP